MVQVHCVLFSSVKKKGNVKWSHEMSLAESEGTVAFFPALL